MLRGCIIGLVLLILIGALLLPQAAVDLHFLLLQKSDRIVLIPSDGWDILISEPKAQQFYWIFLALTALVLIWVIVSGNYLAYRSKMQEVTPDIHTPCAAGQGQFGTAQWMPARHIVRFFFVWRIPRQRAWFRQMMTAGKESYKEVKKANVRID